MPRKKVKLKGGPWDGTERRLPHGGTYTFTVKDFTGHYDDKGYWIQTPQQK